MATKRRKRRRRPQATPATPVQRHDEIAAIYDRWLERNIEMFQVCVHVVEEHGFAEEAAERDAEKQAEILKKQPGEIKGWEKALSDDFVNDTSTNWNASYLPELLSPICKPRLDSPGVVMHDLDKFVWEHDAMLRSAAFAVFEREVWPRAIQRFERMEVAREKNSFKRSLYLLALISEVRQLARYMWNELGFRHRWEELPECLIWIEDDEWMPPE